MRSAENERKNEGGGLVIPESRRLQTLGSTFPRHGAWSPMASCERSLCAAVHGCWRQRCRRIWNKAEQTPATIGESHVLTLPVTTGQEAGNGASRWARTCNPPVNPDPSGLYH
jgi:hypothetical protein